MMFPRYDPERKEILGCKKYGFAYWHEWRHKEQLDLKWLHRTYSIGSVITVNLMLFFFVMAIINWDTIWISGIGLVSLPFLVMVSFMEIDALIFGTINWMKHSSKCVKWSNG